MQQYERRAGLPVHAVPAVLRKNRRRMSVSMIERVSDDVDGWMGQRTNSLWTRSLKEETIGGGDHRYLRLRHGFPRGCDGCISGDVVDQAMEGKTAWMDCKRFPTALQLRRP